MVWGLGGGVGVIGGGYVGQWIYNRAPPRMPLAAGLVTAASVFPMWCGHCSTRRSRTALRYVEP